MRGLAYLLCKTADLIFVVDSDVRDALIDNGFRADKIFMTGNGVEHSTHRFCKSKYEEIRCLLL